MGARFAGLVGATLGITACTLLVDSSGLSDATGDAAITDGASLVETGPDSSDVDGATLGDGASDVAVDAPYVVCPSYARFCDDFESGDFTKWSDVGTKGGGTVTSVTSPVFRGQRAMRAYRPIPAVIDGSTQSTEANAVYGLVPALTTGMIVVRVHIRIPETLAGDASIIKILTSGSDDTNLKVSSGGFLRIDTDTPNAGLEKTSAKKAALDAWFCVEWQMTFGAQGHQTLFVDGQKVLDENEDVSTNAPWSSVSFGFASGSQPSEDVVLYDDVAIATQPLPCP